MGAAHLCERISGENISEGASARRARQVAECRVRAGVRAPVLDGRPCGSGPDGAAPEQIQRQM
eukprot:4069475-Pleurochrysis_carterae.AAC.2